MEAREGPCVVPQVSGLTHLFPPVEASALTSLELAKQTEWVVQCVPGILMSVPCDVDFAFWLFFSGFWSTNSGSDPLLMRAHKTSEALESHWTDTEPKPSLHSSLALALPS